MTDLPRTNSGNPTGLTQRESDVFRLKGLSLLKDRLPLGLALGALIKCINETPLQVTRISAGYKNETTGSIIEVSQTLRAANGEEVQIVGQFFRGETLSNSVLLRERFTISISKVASDLLSQAKQREPMSLLKRRFARTMKVGS